MGTRNLTIVTSNGKVKVAQYCQWDGYLSGQGIVAFEIMKRIIASGQLGQFKTKVDNLKWMDNEQIEKIDNNINWQTEYPYLSRDCGAEVLNAIHFGTIKVSCGIGRNEEKEVKIIGLSNAYEFAADSLFCEWAYVIDLDKATFEVYKGFNKVKLSETERFYPLQGDGEKKYYPIKLLASFDLNNLPSEGEFLSIEKEEE